jgi:tRNA A-37 threonylcarbamoyl transferase component Bud32
MADPAGDPVVGATLAGYRIERRLGRGGMSVVYLAEDLALGRRVALKVLAPELADEAGFRERFRLESRLAASIDHPNVIPIFEAGEAEGQLYIAMRYVDGTDLRRLIDDEGALEPTRAVELVARAADGLDAAHERGLVHRDVKPSNVLIASPGEHEHVYLADFGLTKTAETEDEAREAAQLSGTTDYVAPELITHGATGKSADVYAIGCVLYEALTGQVPFPRSSELETLVAHIDEPAPKPSDVRPEVSADLDAVVERAMAKDPVDRYSSAAELAGAARATLPTERRSRRLAVLLAAVAAVLAGAALAAVVVTRDEQPGPNAPTTELASGAIQRVNPETGKLEATIAVPGQPLDLAVSSGAIWLVDDGVDLVFRINPTTYQREISGATPGTPIRTPQSLAAEPDSVWFGAAGNTGHAVLLPVTPPSEPVKHVDLQALAERSADPGPPLHTLTQVVPDPSVSSSEVFAGWLVDASEGVLRRFRGGPNPTLSPPIDTGGAAHVAIHDGSNLWVGQGQELVKLVRSKVASRTPLPGTPVAIAALTDGLWVATSRKRLVLLGRDGGTVRVLQTAGNAVDLELANGTLWVLDGDGTLTTRDSETGESISSEHVGTNAVALAVGDDAVWVAVRGGRQLERRNLRARLVVTSWSPFEVPQPCGGGPGIGILRNWDNCRTAFGRSLTAKDGTRAGYIGYFWERRVRGGTAECKGKTYDGPAISDVRNEGSGIIWLERWGTLAIQFARMLVVADAVQGAPICGEGTGTWIAMAGPLKGERGEFTFRGPPPEIITLR